MSAQDLEQRGMSLAVALDFADNPRPYHSMACPADTNGELYRALKTLAAALRQQPAPVVDGATVSALQSTRDRMMAALTPKFGDAFDGDFDVMLEAINALKRIRITLARAQGVQS